MLKGIVKLGWKPALGFGAVLAVRESAGRRKEESLAGEVALVTGGSRGLGFKLAELLLAEGCKVAICARDPIELERARTMLAARGEVFAVPCDVCDRVDVNRMIDAITARFGRIDLLINNAGIISVGPLETVTIADFERAMDTMFWGTLYPTLAVLPQMRDRRSGRIVNITSVGGKVSVPHLLPYGAAKFAAVGLSEGLHAELASEGITVTTVVPGEMRTGSHKQALFSGRREEEFRWFALGASLPSTISADRAAGHIIRATKRRQAELIFPWTMSLAVRAHGVAPGLASQVMGLANRMMPTAEGGETGVEKGADVEERMRNPLWDTITVAGRHAANELNEVPPPGTGEQPTA
jgi:NAD(P)-dependent dehydrogenase (short-subunit alcohol dehydrogenase family)